MTRLFASSIFIAFALGTSSCSLVSSAVSQTLPPETCVGLAALKLPLQALSEDSSQLTAGQTLKILNEIDALLSGLTVAQQSDPASAQNPLAGVFSDNLATLRTQLEQADAQASATQVVPALNSTIALMNKSYNVVNGLAQCSSGEIS